MVSFQMSCCQGHYYSNLTNSVVVLFRSISILLLLLASLIALATLVTLSVSPANAQPDAQSDARLSSDCGQASFTPCAVAGGEWTVAYYDDAFWEWWSSQYTSPTTQINEAPTFTRGTTVITVTEDSGLVPSLTVAMYVNDGDGDILTVRLSGASSTPNDTTNGAGALFTRSPTVALSGIAIRNIVLSGGRLHANASGEWAATVLLSDGVATVEVGVVTVSVTPVNDVPNVTRGTTEVTIPENHAFPTLTVATSVSDIDGDALSVMLFNDAADVAETLFSHSPTVALSGAVGAQSVVLSGGRLHTDASGVWTATVRLSDGVTTPVEAGVVTVSVNDTPVFKLGTTVATIAEDHSLSSLTVATDVSDLEGDVLSVALTGASSVPDDLFATLPDVTLSGAVGVQSIVLSGGRLYADANGIWTATVRLSDDIAVIDVGVVTVSVTPVNDAPVFMRYVMGVRMPEDQGSLSSAIVAYGVRDIEGDTLSVMLAGASSVPDDLFSRSPTVKLTGAVGVQSIVLSGGRLYANANGIWAATVLLSDGVATVDTGMITVSVTPVNDAPAFTVGTTVMTIPEDSGSSSSVIVATGVSDIDGDTLSVTLADASSVPDDLFATRPGVVLSGAAGAQSIVLSGGRLYADANGEWTATVLLSDAEDAEGATPVEVGVVTVSVTPVNDAPAFTVGTTVMMIPEDSGSLSSVIVATGVSDIEGDALTVMLTGASSVSDDLFATLPDVILSGVVGVQSIVLSGGRLYANANGVWAATVLLSDGVATVDTGMITVSVTPVNDAPVFTVGTTVMTIPEDTDSLSSVIVATGVSDIEGDALSVILTGASSVPDDLFATLPDVTLSGAVGTQSIVLSGGRLSADANGVWTATVRLSDAEDAEGATPVEVGVVTVSVTPVNDAPVFTVGTTVMMIPEDTDSLSSVTVRLVATGVSDIEGDALSVTLAGASSVPDDLFATLPDVILSGAVGVQSIVLSGGRLYANANGEWTATVLLSDAEGATPVEVGVVTVSVTPVNDAPAFTVGTTVMTVPEDSGSLSSLAVATGVSDIEGNALSVTLADASSVPDDLFATLPDVTLSGAAGAQSIVLSGGRLYADANGEWTATVLLSDAEDAEGATPVEVGVVTVSVTPVNDAPAFTVGTTVMTKPEDSGSLSSLTVATGVSDIEGNALSVTLAGVSSVPDDLFATLPGVTLSGAVGVQSIVLSGGRLYANANGEWTATVRLSDGVAVVNVGVVTVSVTPVNDAPVFTVGTTVMTVPEDSGSLSSLAVATGVSDIEGNALSVTLADASSVPDDLFATLPDVTLSGAVGVQSIVLSGGRLYANANGEWTATVLLSDAEGATPVEVGVVTVSVTPVNDAPAFTVGTTVMTVPEDSGSLSSLAVATGVSDIEGNALSVTLADASSVPDDLFATLPGVVLSGAAGAQSVVLSSGRLSANATGIWTATVLLSDAEDAEGATTVEVCVVTVSVTPVNDAPAFTVGTTVMTKPEDSDSLSSLTVATGVSDIEGNALSVTLAGVSSVPDDLFATLPGVTLSGAVGVQSIVLSGGRLYANANGEWTATVRLSDGVAVVDVGVVTVSVTPVNDAPAFTVGTTVMMIPEDTDSLSSVIVATGVSDIEGDALSVTLAGASSVPDDLFATLPDVILSGAVGVQSIVLSGGRLYANANGEWTATVRLSDGVAVVNVGVVTVSVTPVNDAPVFTVGTTVMTVPEDSGSLSSLAVATGVSDIEGNALSVTLAGASSVPDDLFATLPDVTLSGAVGVQSIVLSGGRLYANANGEWTATVRLSDGVAVVNVGVVTVSVTPVNDAPVFTVGTTVMTVPEDSGSLSSLAVATGVSDIEGNALSVTLADASSVPDDLFATLPDVTLSGAAGAQSIVLSGGSLYADANGEWTATVLLSDAEDAEGATTVEVGVVTVSVTPVNDAPAFTVGTTVMTVPEDSDSLSSLTVATGVSDIEGNALSVTLAGASSVPDDLFATLPDVALSGAAGAQSIVLSGGRLYANANGEWTATVRLSDGVAVVNVGVVTVSVTPVNDAPVFTVGTTVMTVPEDSGSLSSLAVATGVSDIEGNALSVTLADASSVPDDLFATLPDVTLSGAAGAQSIVLSGGRLSANATGIWTATVLLSDAEDAEGATTVEVGVVTVSVTPVNDAPAFTVGTTVMTVPEDSGSLSSLTVATGVSDIEGNALSVTLADASSVPDDLFATLPGVVLSGAVDAQSIVLSGGRLYVNANGVWTATVRLSDGVAVVNVGVVTVSVTPVNDAPAFTVGTTVMTIPEDSGSLSSLAVATGVSDIEGNALSVTLADASSVPDDLFATLPGVVLSGAVGAQSIVLSGGRLYVNANGEWTATVRLSDGVAVVDVGVVTVSVTPVNDAPVFTVGTTVMTVPEDSGSLSSLTVATGVSDIEGNALSVTLAGASSVPDDLFATLPGVTLSGAVGVQSVVLSGGRLYADANGVWTATVLRCRMRRCAEGATPVEVSVWSQCR